MKYFNSCYLQNEQTKKEFKPLHFVFITTCVGEDFFIPVKKGMEQSATLLGVDCSFIGTKEVDIKEQVAMVSDAIKMGVNGIALNIIDTLAFDTIIQKAIDNGIPVVAFNSDDNKTPNLRLSGISQNFYQAGYDLGKRISKKLDKNTTILITLHSKGISALDERVRGIQDALKRKNVKWKIIVTGIHADTAAYLIKNALMENPEIKTILCTGQVDTEGAGMVIENFFKEKNYFAAGFDLSPKIIRYIKKGHILFSIDQQPFMQGFYPVLQLYQYCSYGILPSDNEIVSSFVTQENVKEVEKLCRQHFR